jgi:hypothetical protein
MHYARAAADERMIGGGGLAALFVLITIGRTTAANGLEGACRLPCYDGKPLFICLSSGNGHDPKTIA